jgi:1,4-alpha-glucan branching enzyme
MQKKGYLSFVLHAHLPFIHHPESDDYLEESWLYEAISETYIPLLQNFQKLVDEGVKFRITMTMTPPLLSMLDSKLLQNKYIKYLEQHIELAEKEIKRTTYDTRVNELSKYYFERYSNDLHWFKDIYNCNLISGFKKFQDLGVLEIITCGATHGYFPILYINEKTVRAQIAVGVQTYERYFGKKPRGIWLPECGYVPEADKYLREFGIDYAIVETHGVLYAKPTPIYGTLSPIVSPRGFTVFGRDLESSRQVWSSINGYPGDFNYREFYRDIGYDLDFDYIKPYIHESGMRLNTGIKYYRITDRNSSQKEPYSYQEAMKRAAAHGAHFIWCRERQVEYLMKHMDRKPIVVAPYDCELFGHWWYEGPDFIYYILKKTSLESKYVSLVTPSDYIDYYPGIQKATPSDSTWGANGYSEVWLNETNAYIYPHMHKAAERMIKLADNFPDAEGLTRDALNQAARELMLLQSSDWAFIMKMDTTVGYAKKRVKDHVFRFTKLYEDINKGQINESWLREVEKRDNIFPEMDYRVYRSSRNDK